MLVIFSSIFIVNDFSENRNADIRKRGGLDDADNEAVKTRDAGKILVCTGGGDRTNTLQTHLNSQNLPFDVENPGQTSGHSAEYLFDNYYAIYTGCQGDICDNSLKNMMNGGIIENFVTMGGIFIANSAHNCGPDITGPGGSNFGSYQASGTTDENPQVGDNDHEFITGQGYGGNQLNANNFQNWGTSCHGYVTAPPGFSDSGGVNLGTDPTPNLWNDILWSNGNNKPAFVEYVLGEGYVMMNMMTFDWGNRGNNELLQMINYIEFVKDNFPFSRVPRADSIQIDGSSQSPFVCYAGYREYKITVNVTTFESIHDLSDVRIFLDYNTTNITLGFNGTNEIFYKLNDPEGHVQLMGTSESSQDGVERWWVNFSVRFNYTFPHEQLIDCLINTTASFGDTDLERFPWVFKIENDLQFWGNIKVQGEYQGQLTEGDWIRGGEGLVLEGVWVTYQNTSDVYPDDEHFDVRVTDSMGTIWWDNHSSQEEVGISIEAKNITDENERFHLKIVNIPGMGACATNISIGFMVDADPPDPPFEIMTHAYGKESPFTKVPSINVTWKDSDDNASGLLGYYYSSHDNGGTDNGTFTEIGEGEIMDLDEGVNNIYVWCEDNVGNIGFSSSAQVQVDMSSPVFSDFTPSPEIWQNQTSVECLVKISDPNGTGVDGGAVFYSISTEGPNRFGAWVPLWIPQNDLSIIASTKTKFDEGSDNYIKWKAKDLADNQFSESAPQRILIDTSPIEFGDTLIPQRNWYLYREITAKIEVWDSGASGVNLERLEARFSTAGDNDFGPWLKVSPDNITEPEEGKRQLSVTFRFAGGEGNYIQFRGTDVAGNPEVYSKKFKIQVDITPVYFGDFVIEDTDDLPEVECSIRIFDEHSGVDIGSLAYSISTQGDIEEEYGEWLMPGPMNIITGRPVVVYCTPEFQWGRDNYIRFRANDLVGWGEVVSGSYRINVTSEPVAKISRPEEHRTVFNSTQVVELDGSGSFDKDGDNLTFVWESNQSGNLGNNSTLIIFMEPGNHTVTLYVTDADGNSADKDVLIDIRKVSSGNGGDDDDNGGGGGSVIGAGDGGCPWWWWIVLVIVILLLLLLVLFLVARRRKRKNEEEEERKRLQKERARRQAMPAQQPYAPGPRFPGLAAPSPYAPGPASQQVAQPRYNMNVQRPPALPGYVSPPQALGPAPVQRPALPAAPPEPQQSPPPPPDSPQVPDYDLPTFTTSSGEQDLNRMALPPAPDELPADSEKDASPPPDSVSRTPSTSSSPPPPPASQAPADEPVDNKSDGKPSMDDIFGSLEKMSSPSDDGTPALPPPES